MNHLECSAQKLLTASLHYAKKNISHWHLSPAVEERLYTPDNLSVITALLQVESFPEDSARQYLEMMQPMSTQLKELEEIKELLPSVNASDHDQKLALYTQINETCYLLLYRVNKMAYHFRKAYLEKRISYNDSDIIDSLFKYAFQESVLRPIQYPAFFAQMSHILCEIITSLLPDAYRETLEKNIKDKGILVALEDIFDQSSDWIQSGNALEENIQKVHIVSCLLSTLRNDEELLDLASKNVLVMSQLFSQQKLSDFLGNAVVLNTSERQKYIEDFILSSRGQLDRSSTQNPPVSRFLH